MNTREVPSFAEWDERELTLLVGAYVKAFRRLPSPSDVLRFERARTDPRSGLVPLGGQRPA